MSMPLFFAGLVLTLSTVVNGSSYPRIAIVRDCALLALVVFLLKLN